MPGNAALFAVLAIAVHRPVGAPVMASRGKASRQQISEGIGVLNDRSARVFVIPPTPDNF
jgi:hypothetical protein